MTMVAAAAIAFSAFVTAHAQKWAPHVDWSAQDTGTGGQVNCPGSYISMGVRYAIAVGGQICCD
jgi:hypothetical protein